MRVLSIVCLSVLTLAACNRGDEAEQPAEGPVAAPPVAPSVPTRPIRKPGLWETSASVEGLDAVQTVRLCLDAATDERLSLAGGQAGAAQCRNSQTREADGSWRFSSACDMGSGGTVTTVGTATGDFSSRYTVTADSTTSGAAVPQMNRSQRVTVQAAWRGACPADMKPGDLSVPGVGVISLSGAG